MELEAAKVIGADGEICSAAAGTRGAGSDVAMSNDTVCWIASMTKAITGTAAMQLVEQGKLSLDGPGADVLPLLGELDVLTGFDDDGKITALDVKKGDKVLYGKWSGTVVKLDGKSMLIMRESDIMGVMQ